MSGFFTQMAAPKYLPIHEMWTYLSCFFINNEDNTGDDSSTVLSHYNAVVGVHRTQPCLNQTVVYKDTRPWDLLIQAYTCIAKTEVTSMHYISKQIAICDDRDIVWTCQFQLNMAEICIFSLLSRIM